MKKLTLLFCLFILCRISFAQNSHIWAKCLGGAGDDEGYSIATTHDKGYIIAGMSFSPVGGDITFTHGFGDVWVVKLDSLGAIQWQKCYGGSGPDWGKSIKETPDHGFIVAGTTFDSYGGDITQLYGGIDYWTIKIDSVGNLIWAKTFGGYSDDELYSVALANDGGYVFAGTAYSNDGNVTGNHGHSDFWAVKTDVNGNIVWKKCYGGPMWDHCFAISATADHGFVLCGDAGGNGGDVTGVHTNAVNYWIVKIDSVGNLEWQKVYGGYSYDVAYSIKQTADKGYIVGGTAQSNNGDVIGNHGYNDYWALRLDSSGNLLWQKALGGSNDDECYGADISADGGYFFGGWSFSHNGDVTDQIGNGDYWIVKLDSAGGIQSKRSYGGSGSDWCYAIQITPDGGMIATGYSQSNNIDVSGNHGGGDYWVVKQRDDNLITGTCFLDANMNGIQDSTENGFDHFLVHASGGSYTYAAQPDVNGIFRCYADTGTILTHVHTSSYYSAVPEEDSSEFRSFYNTDTVNFAIQPHPGIQDLRIEIIPTDIATPGAQTNYRLVYTSAGTDTISGTVILFPDSDLFYVSADPPADSLTTDSIKWNFESLLPYETRVINVKLQADIPPDVIAGDYLVSTAVIEPLASDSNKNDNTFTVRQEVLASLDPNDKSMLGGNSITPEQVMNGDDLTYLIRFQNTGNAPAINITITDTLSDLLDWNTFYPVDVSHPYSLSIKDDRFVTWQFDNILLPDSNTNEPESHGYIVYGIKPKSTLTYGDSVHNTASIYFDYNDPVKTNDAVVTVCTNSFSEITQTICIGDSLFAGGGWQQIPGAYYDYFSTVHGCDSIIKTILAFNIIDTTIQVFANTIVATTTGAGYQWMDCDNGSPISGATDQSFAPSYSGNFSVAITSGNCSALSSCIGFVCEDSIETSSTICEGDSIFAGGGWQHQPGVYLDHYQNINGCDSLVQTNVDVTFVEDSVSVTGDILTALMDSAIYQWIDCDNGQPIAGATNQTFEAVIAGDYKVQITANGCTTISSCISVVETGLSQPYPENIFSLYPNPAGDFVNIVSSECCISKIEFCNSLGIPLKSIMNNHTKSVEVFIGDLSSGIYIVKLWDDKSNVVYKTITKK